MASSVPTVQSPLLQQARNCYLNRRKHSKRIKKLTRRTEREEPELNLRRIRSAPQGQQTEVLKVLAQRQIPPFLMELVRKKRIFNIGSIKKMAISPVGDSHEFPSLNLMAQHCRRQEEELQQIITENRLRFQETRRQAQALTLTRRATIAVIREHDAHSSTMSLDSQTHNSQQHANYQSYSPDSYEQVDHPNQPTNMLDFNEPMDALQSSHHQSIFMTMF